MDNATGVRLVSYWPADIESIKRLTNGCLFIINWGLAFFIAKSSSAKVYSIITKTEHNCMTSLLQIVRSNTTLSKLLSSIFQDCFKDFSVLLLFRFGISIYNPECPVAYSYRYNVAKTAVRKQLR